jgi:predicted NBD/HSP70 family sugar kinase
MVSMFAGVDIGGSKTLVAAFDDSGVIIEKNRFETPSDYSSFLKELKTVVSSLKTSDFRAGCVAVPGKVDRERGIGEYFGNETWHNVPIQADVEKIFNCPLVIENDANLGALSESMLQPEDKRLLYVTISTGIGTGFIIHREFAPDLIDSEGGQMLFEYHGKRTAWEDFASGRAIMQRFGKRAADITDEKIWQRFARDLAVGFTELIAISQPDIIIIGGSVGKYFDRFKAFLLEELHKYDNPLVPIPEFQQAQRPAEAVIYGCYDLAVKHYGTDH